MATSLDFELYMVKYAKNMLEGARGFTFDRALAVFQDNYNRFLNVYNRMKALQEESIKMSYGGVATIRSSLKNIYKLLGDILKDGMHLFAIEGKKEIPKRTLEIIKSVNNFRDKFNKREYSYIKYVRKLEFITGMAPDYKAVLHDEVEVALNKVGYYSDPKIRAWFDFQFTEIDKVVVNYVEELIKG